MAKPGGPRREGSVTDPWVMSPRNKQEEKEPQNSAQENESPKEKEGGQQKVIQSETQNDEKTPQNVEITKTSENENAEINKNSKNENGDITETLENENVEIAKTSENESKPAKREETITLNNGNDQNSDESVLPKQDTVTLNGDLKTDVENTDSKEDNSVDDESEYYDPDLIITEEEAKEFEEMLAKRKEDLVNQKIKFEKWTDGITRRRMFALSRLRKLGLGQKKRINFYKQMGNFVIESGEVFKNIIESKNVEIIPNKSQEGSPSVTRNNKPEVEIKMSNEGIGARELTGFVMKSNSSDVVHNTEQTVNEEKSNSSDALTKSEQNVTKDNLNVGEATTQDTSPVIVPVES